MSARTVFRAARAAGVRIALDGDELVLDAPLEPPADILDLIARHKAEIVRALSLRQTQTAWSVEDWLAFFDERAAINEFDQGMSRPEAEARAFGCCVAEWLNRNPMISTPGRCLWCGADASGGATILPFGLDPRGRAWLHARCWPRWRERREVEAAAALVAAGIQRPSDGTHP